MARWGSTTRKKITALTLTDTLSLVMTSWVGTSIVIVWRFTRIIRCRTGITMMTPGPLTCWNFPKKKITPRSYSMRTLMLL